MFTTSFTWVTAEKTAPKSTTYPGRNKMNSPLDPTRKAKLLVRYEIKEKPLKSAVKPLAPEKLIQEITFS